MRAKRRKNKQNANTHISFGNEAAHESLKQSYQHTVKQVRGGEHVKRRMEEGYHKTSVAMIN